MTQEPLVRVLYLRRFRKMAGLNEPRDKGRAQLPRPKAAHRWHQHLEGGYHWGSGSPTPASQCLIQPATVPSVHPRQWAYPGLDADL